MVLSKIFKHYCTPAEEGDGPRHYEKLISKKLFKSRKDAQDYFAAMQEETPEERKKELSQTIKPAEWPKNIGKDGYNVRDQMDWA